tara:strand:+ start:714 stop:893 length:180 start_codon:yes stop_codon:yes gene_type:complete
MVAPQFVQTLNLDLRELIPKKTININTKGIKNIKIKKLPIKLNTKLNPKKKIISKDKIL